MWWTTGAVGWTVRSIAAALLALVLLAPLPSGGSVSAVHAQFDDLIPVAAVVTGNLDVDLEPVPAAPRLPYVRSFTCPIVYTHEVPSRPAFRNLVVGLRASGYRPITLSALDAALNGTTPVPNGCMVLTFDDALMTQVTNALPVLTELGVPGVFFVMPNFSDGVHHYMRAPEIRALAEGGQEVMAHTCNHATLPTLLRRNRFAFLAELVDCRNQVEAITGKQIDYLAYPNGSYDALTMQEVKDAGYSAAFTTRPSAYLPAGNPFALPRILFNPSETAGSLIARIREAR